MAFLLLNSNFRSCVCRSDKHRTAKHLRIHTDHLLSSDERSATGQQTLLQILSKYFTFMNRWRSEGLLPVGTEVYLCLWWWMFLLYRYPYWVWTKQWHLWTIRRSSRWTIIIVRWPEHWLWSFCTCRSLEFNEIMKGASHHWHLFFCEIKPQIKSSIELCDSCSALWTLFIVDSVCEMFWK